MNCFCNPYMSTTSSDINSTFQNAASGHLSFAAWRLPEETDIQHITGITTIKRFSEINFPAFVITPFDKKPGELLIIEKRERIEAEAHYSINPPQLSPIGKLDKNSYIDLVKRGINAIQKGDFQKVVLSRQLQIDFHESFNPVELFLQLVEAYPKAFVSLVSSPHTGTWIGASPELFIKKEKDFIQSISLAGTIRSLEIENGGKVSSKDQVEQEIVSQFIREKLTFLGMPYTESNPELINTGNLNHIKTTFTAADPDSKLEHIIDTLHPTPAICGYPRDRSKDFILKHEKYSRILYGGLLGPVYSLQNAELYVNLRCIQIIENKGILYAGAGILSNSNAEEEWRETEYKMDTLRSFL